jgi:hypothetical protein
MATIRITGTTPKNIHKMQWLGAPAVDQLGHIERSLDLPETTYQRMEEGIGKGYIEGILNLDDGRRLEWFLDRGAATSGPARGTALPGSGEGI